MGLQRMMKGVLGLGLVAGWIGCGGTSGGPPPGDGPDEEAQREAMEASFGPGSVPEVVNGGGFEASVLEVTPEAFAALTSLPLGHPYSEVAQVPGGAEALSALGAPPSGSGPVALCSTVKIPVGQDACADITPALVDRASFDPDSAEAGMAALEAIVDQSSVCGLKEHQVKLTVFDAEGLSSECTAPVVLCADGADGCPAQPVKNEGVAISNGCTGQVQCTWLALPRVRREASFVRSPSSFPSDAYRWGPGPYHALVSRDEDRSCATPNSNYDTIKDGEAGVQLGLVCRDETGLACDPGCNPKVDLHAIYRSKIRARSKLGDTCLWDTNQTEAVASDEVAFTANGTPVFEKGAASSNGNQVETTISFELGAEVGKSHEGWAGNASVNFGSSVTIVDGTQPEAAWEPLVATSGTRVDAPAHGVLMSKGRARIRSRYRAFGMAEVVGNDWLLFWATQSTCPVANAGGGIYAGQVGGEIDRDKQFANEFWEVRGVDYRW